jgi:hypothetical protein
LGLDEAEKPAKAKGFFSPSETNGFASRSQVVEIIMGAKFLVMVCFQGLDPLFVSLKSQPPSRPLKRRAGLAVSSGKQYQTHAGPSRKSRLSCRAPDRRPSPPAGTAQTIPSTESRISCGQKGYSCAWNVHRFLKAFRGI